MNRRKFFPFLGIGSVAAVLSPKLSASPTQHDDMWVKIVCENKLTSEGRVFRKPNYGDIHDAQHKVETLKFIYQSIGGEGRLTKLQSAESSLQEAWLQHDTGMNEWESLDACNCSYKRLLGTHVNCPKCGELSPGFTGRDSGIVV